VPEDPYTAPVIETALLAAAAVSERAYELTPGIPTDLDSALRGLVEATYEWTEGLDLQRELDAGGARAGAVANLADPTYAASYAVRVHSVLTAARAVREAVAQHPHALPASAEPLLGRLGSALTEWEQLPVAAARWREEGGRPALVLSPPTPPEPPETPTPLARPAIRSPSGDDLPPPAGPPREGRDGAGAAARMPRSPIARPLPADVPLWRPDRPQGATAPRSTESEPSRRDRVAREAADAARQPSVQLP